MRHRRWRIPLLIVGGIITAGFVMLSARGRGVEAIIRNAGKTDMRDLRVIVTGKSYAIGDLPAGEARAVYVKPTGESHIELTFADADGVAQRVAVDCYFESGGSGSITVDVADGAVVKVADRTRI